MSETSPKNKPVHKIRYGNVIASIWADNSMSGYFYNTTFCKIYKNGDRWCDTFSFEDRDLPNLAKVATDAHTWIYERKANVIIVQGSEDPESLTDSTNKNLLPVIYDGKQ
jgi:hypothetical protein